MIRAFSLVAPVPRAEDAGVDAVCTLLRPDGGGSRRSVFPEASYYVQVKSAGIENRGLLIEGDHYRYVRDLQMPFFVLTVRMLGEVRCRLWSTIGLYPTSSAPQLQDTGVLLQFTSEEASQPGGGVRGIALGQPILEWTPNDLADDEFHDRAYGVMRKWLDLLLLNQVLREMFIRPAITWETNAPPVAGVPQIHGSAADTARDLRILNNPLTKLWANELLSHTPTHPLRDPVKAIFEYMQLQGIELHPFVLETMNQYDMS
jgi:hypothetical protein